MRVHRPFVVRRYDRSCPVEQLEERQVLAGQISGVLGGAVSLVADINNAPAEMRLGPAAKIDDGICALAFGPDADLWKFSGAPEAEKAAELDSGFTDLHDLQSLNGQLVWSLDRWADQHEEGRLGASMNHEIWTSLGEAETTELVSDKDGWFYGFQDYQYVATYDHEVAPLMTAKSHRVVAHWSWRR